LADSITIMEFTPLRSGLTGSSILTWAMKAKQLRRPLNKEVPLHGMITNVASKPVIDLDAAK